MAKGYWLVAADITDSEGYKEYLAESGKAFARFGARFLVRGGSSEQVEGKGRSRFVVLEFKDCATALECYRSTEYSTAPLVMAEPSSTSLSPRAMTARSPPIELIDTWGARVFAGKEGLARRATPHGRRGAQQQRVASGSGRTSRP